jgi:hypothetical protein
LLRGQCKVWQHFGPGNGRVVAVSCKRHRVVVGHLRDVKHVEGVDDESVLQGSYRVHPKHTRMVTCTLDTRSNKHMATCMNVPTHPSAITASMRNALTRCRDANLAKASAAERATAHRHIEPPGGHHHRRRTLRWHGVPQPTQELVVRAVPAVLWAAGGQQQQLHRRGVVVPQKRRVVNHARPTDTCTCTACGAAHTGNGADNTRCERHGGGVIGGVERGGGGGGLGPTNVKMRRAACPLERPERPWGQLTTDAPWALPPNL